MICFKRMITNSVTYVASKTNQNHTDCDQYNWCLYKIVYAIWLFTLIQYAMQTIFVMCMWVWVCVTIEWIDALKYNSVLHVYYSDLTVNALSCSYTVQYVCNSGAWTGVRPSLEHHYTVRVISPIYTTRLFIVLRHHTLANQKIAWYDAPHVTVHS
jgi:hypothetical protein